jgi:hypothetical protein
MRPQALSLALLAHHAFEARREGLAQRHVGEPCLGVADAEESGELAAWLGKWDRAR